MGIKLAVSSTFKALVAAAVVTTLVVGAIAVFSPKAHSQTFNFDLCFGTPQEFKAFYLKYRITDIPVCGYSQAQMTDLIARINAGKF